MRAWTGPPGITGLRDYHVRLRDLAVESGRPITFGVFSRREVPGVWRDVPGPAGRDGGGRRTHVRAGAQPVAERAALVQDPAAVRHACRSGRISARSRSPSSGGRSAIRGCAAGWSRPRTSRRAAARSAPRPGDADYDWILVFDTVAGPHRTVAAVARERGQHPAETMIDLALEGPRPLLPAAGRERGSGYRARADAASAHGHDVLGLRRPRLPAHGLVAPDARAQPLGARQAGVHAGAGRAHGDASCRPRSGGSPIAG